MIADRFCQLVNRGFHSEIVSHKETLKAEQERRGK
uniref:Uncharacterized protein n=1 Tax=Ascaris lumbricoides TaxID=6252 RepID=A0A0M3HGZ6_ASCLU